jgi:tRNA(fMet)-specific endonuclease VapC
MFLFDTDTITNIVKPRPSPRLLERLAKVDASQQFISTISVAEIVYGAFRSSRPEHHLHNLEHVLLPGVNIADFDARAAYAAGRIRADLEKKGQPLAFVDIQIAAIAIVNELTLITGNTAHFERVPGLQMADWL